MPYVQVWVDDCDCPSQEEVDELQLMLSRSYQSIRFALASLSLGEIQMAIAELETALADDRQAQDLKREPTEADRRYKKWLEAGKPAPIIEFETGGRRAFSSGPRA